MAIRVRCPRCWETAEVPDDALGKRGVCNSCGAQVTIPAKLTKVCFICGADVTRVKHTKDLEGNYLCMSCFETRNPDQQASFQVPTIECSVCHAPFAEGEGHVRDGKPVCRDCFGHSDLFGSLGEEIKRHEAGENGRRAPEQAEEGGQRRASVEEPAAVAEKEAPPQIAPHVWGKSLVEQADEVELTPRNGEPAGPPRSGRPPERRKANPAALAFSLVALAGVGVLGFEQWKTRGNVWDQSNRAKIIALRAQGQVLVELGKVREGYEKYAELARLTEGHEASDPALRAEIEQARREMRQASSMVIENWEAENRTRAQILAAQAEVLALVGKYAEALDRYDELFRLVQGRSLSPALADEIRRARAAYRQVQARQEQERRAPRVGPVPPVNPGPATHSSNPAPGTESPRSGPQRQTGQAEQPPAEPARRPNIFDDPAREERPPASRPAPAPPKRSIFD